MSVFFGATGSPFCCLTVSLRLTGDVGIRPPVRVLVGRVVGFAEDGTRSGLGRTRLWRRVGLEEVIFVGSVLDGASSVNCEVAEGFRFDTVRPIFAVGFLDVRRELEGSGVQLILPASESLGRKPNASGLACRDHSFSCRLERGKEMEE
jgi:hypothetical protein